MNLKLTTMKAIFLGIEIKIVRTTCFYLNQFSFISALLQVASKSKMWCDGFCGALINILLIIFVVIALHYVYLLWNSDYWKKRGVFCPDSKALFGNLPGQVTGKRNIVYDMDDLYQQYKEKYSYIGIYQFRQPRLLVFDPVVIKDIMIKYFKYFQGTEFYGKIDQKSDPLFGNHSFVLVGDEWKAKRAEMTPGFTNSRVEYSVCFLKNKKSKNSF